MRQREQKSKHPRRLFGIAASTAALLCLGLLTASPAAAAYEQVGCFAGSLPENPCAPVAEEKFSEEVQLNGVGGMAVNYTGAGGVPAGTVYAITLAGGNGQAVAMFAPKPGGGLEFRRRWEVSVFEAPYVRCGPALGTKCDPTAKGAAVAGDVDIDQATGNVYVFPQSLPPAGTPKIIEYSPDGSEVITRFGEQAAEGKTTAETPSQVHNSPGSGNMAVNGAGEVYIFDLNSQDQRYRLAVFAPQSPGDYAHYAYAGEVVAGVEGGEGHFPVKPVADAAGHIYVAGDGYIEEYAAEAPAPYPAPAAEPICSFTFAKGGITAITVDPLGEDVFFFSEKAPKRLRRLGPCDEATGKFTEIEPEAGKVEPEAFKVAPERGDLYALAFDPLRAFSAGRAPGMLYGGAPSEVPFGVGKGEPGQSSLGYIFSRPLELSPLVESQSVSHVGATTALLRARINPEGSATRYAFQYLTEAEYEANEPSERFAGASEAPPGGASLGAGSQGLPALAPIAGLSPETEYRFRVLASSHCAEGEPLKTCTGAGPAQAFRTFPLEAPGLPDKRAWELVSPTDKHGGQVYVADEHIGSCRPAFCKPGSQYSHPMQSAPSGEAVAYAGAPFSPTEGAVEENEYIARRSGSGWQTTNLTPQRLNTGTGYQAFDAGLNQGVMEQLIPALSPEAPGEYANVYAQPTADPLSLTPLLGQEPPNRLPGTGTESGLLTIVFAGASADFSRLFFKANDALTGETPFAPEALDGGPSKSNLYEWHEGQLALVNVLPGNAETRPGASMGVPSTQAVSADGSRAFFSDEAGQVFVREDAEVTKAILGPGKFLFASADGSKVLLTNGRLYDLETEATTDLTEGKGGFQGVAGQSEDLSRVYFLDTAVLDEAPNGQGESAEAGAFNLYAWQQGSAPRFVARLLGEDNSDSLLSGDWASTPAARTAEASPHGRYLSFLSRAPLSGYDNTGPCAEISGTGTFVQAPCREAFLYDSATDELVCASCNPSGAAPLGNANLRRIYLSTIQPQPRYLSDEGRLFFDSQDSLSPFDTNEGTVPGHAVEDVYEYEPDGVGSCERQRGCISLISAGHEAVDSNFLSMSEDGKNAFFTSRDQLTLKDKDDLIDLYDARVEGGIPSETEVARGECQGEACQPLYSAPNDPTPGSSSFEGAGNVEEATHNKKKHKHKKKKAKKHAHKRAAKHNRGGGK